MNMPKQSNIELLHQNEQNVLCIRTITSVEELPKLIGESYGKLAAYLKELNEVLAEVPYVCYHNMDMGALDIEIGFPVTGVLPGKEDIQTGTIPAGKRIFCMYRGPYQLLEPVYQEMDEYLKKHSYEPVGTAYEFYYNDMSFPEEELLTKIVMPIK
ncbi:GyrI-like domain-containing protein [Bacillus sp. 1P06AnD]|uniref:GyrI-like domain-containing protein n=1 Tax=Bacillus sp. 1P06AnD TaxID=3132208 RepID=UPI0039A0AB6E